MKTIATVKLGMIGLTDVQILEKGRNHVKMLTGNAAFPTPEPALSEITAACDDLEKSIQEVLMQGGKMAHSLKRTRLVALKALIKELGGYVQAVSAGDRDLILSASFECRSGAKPVDKLEMPQNLRSVLTDFTGQVILRWNRVADAINHQVFINRTNPDEEKAWEPLAFTSRSTYTVEGLDSVKHYWFRVQSIGRKGLVSPFSKTLKALAA